MSVMARVRAAQRAVRTMRIVPVEPPPPRAFGAEWCRKYLGHYFADDAADFHDELFDRLSGLHTHRGTKEAVIAPRGGAKSTVITLGYVLHGALEGLEPFTLILSDSASQAVEQLQHIRHELATNEELIRDYPDAAGVGPVWRAGKLELRNGSVVGALGTGGKIRGRKARQARPSLVVFDDVESTDTIVSQAKREKAWRWVTRDVLPVGDDRTNFLSVGSALHREAVAVKLGTLPGWSGRTYPAVHRWPDEMGLWEQWERLATNLADPDRIATAEKFYTANRAAMDRGAKVYWPSRWPLVALMSKRAEIGVAAFDTEYQGKPSVEGLTEWPAEYLDFPDMWFTDWPQDLVYRVQGLDPSKGSDSKRGDFQAHTLLGLDCNGKLYVEAALNRETVPDMIAHALDLPRLSGFGHLNGLAVESNDTLGMLVSEFKEQMAKRGTPYPVQPIRNTVNKVARIRRLGIYFGRKRVRFRNTQGTRLLVDQLRGFPDPAVADDGPDSFELAVRYLENLTNAPGGW